MRNITPLVKPYTPVDSNQVLPEKSPQKLPRGRPRGFPKTGGRKKGTPNKSAAATREQIMQADPVKFLIGVMQGKRYARAAHPNGNERTWVFPTLEMSQKAAEVLARKYVPDVKNVEVNGAVDNRPVQIIVSTGIDRTPRVIDVTPEQSNQALINASEFAPDPDRDDGDKF